MKPKAKVDMKFSAEESLASMLDIDSHLYNRILDTPVFAYHFNQLACKAVHFDYLVNKVSPGYMVDAVKGTNELTKVQQGEEE